MLRLNMIIDLCANSKIVFESDHCRREEFFHALKKVFFDVMNENLPIYGVAAQKLKEYSTSKKDMKAGNEYQPNDAHRIRSEDIYKSATTQDT